jgi:hypothetical protein
MRYFLFLILSFILIGCATNKDSVKKFDETILLQKDSIRLIEDTITNDFLESIKLEEVSNEKEVDKVASTQNESLIIENPNLRTINVTHRNRIVSKHERKTQLTIVDKSNDLDTTKGWIVYSVPEQMKVAKSYSIKVRISKKKNSQNKAILILGDYNDDAINNSNYTSVATIEDIKVSGEMKAELRGDNDLFNISSLSTEIQSIDDVDYTEWEWSVVPKKSGENSLKLVIKLKDLNKDIIVFNKNIIIKKNVSVAVEGFFDKYWQWFMTTIIIPIFIYFWNRKKKRKQTKKS